jgi:A/G-specific adenine glycosylase
MYRRLVSVARSPRQVARNPEESLEALRAIGLKTAADAVVKIAVEVNERFGGKLPEDPLDLRSLQGVGDSLAEAVRCFGFGRPSVLVDSSTGRVCTRVLGREEDRRFQLRLDLYGLAGPSGPDAPFNRALLELGETVCRPSGPRCAECPVAELCARAATVEVVDERPEEVLAA